jgi:hypothetical protein
MKLTKERMLRMLAEGGGETTEYPYIEYGLEYILEELLSDGLVIRIPRPDDFDLIRITKKGRDVVADQTNSE